MKTEGQLDPNREKTYETVSKTCSRRRGHHDAERHSHGAVQGDRRSRRRLVPLLPADRAGAAIGQFRKSGRHRRPGQLQGRLASADSRDRRQRGRRLGLFRPYGQPGRQEAVAPGLRDL